VEGWGMQFMLILPGGECFPRNDKAVCLPVPSDAGNYGASMDADRELRCIETALVENAIMIIVSMLLKTNYTNMYSQHKTTKTSSKERIAMQGYEEEQQDTVRKRFS
jgi:hypothetical protein